MRNKYFVLLMVLVCVVLGSLLTCCGENAQISTPTQNTTSSTAPTETPEIDPDMPYFTWEEFETIVPGESTVVDIYNVTGVYTTMVATSYGGLSEYPMRDGKCIRVEYGPGYVVRNIKIAKATLGQYNPNNSIGFEDYNSYVAFLRNPTAEKSLSELHTSKEIIAYIQDIRDGKTPLMLPYHKNEPVALESEADYPIPSTVLICYRLFIGTSFTTVMSETNVSICISALSEEEAKMAKEMSCSELIATLSPLTPNVDNYEPGEYAAVFEDSAIINGESISMLVAQKTEGIERIFFVMDGFMIDIYATIGTVTKDWLQDFSIVAH